MRSWLAVYGKLAFMLLALGAALPQSALALTASQVYEQVKDSVVVVKAYDQTGKLVSMGSGVMLPSGEVITNYHVVKAGVRYTVGQGKKGVPATLKAGDPKKDLCLLMAPGLTAKPARLGQAARLKVGEPVYAVGAPQGLELSLSEGIVSQLRGGPPPIIQTTVAISKGSSGGGLFNAEGELVGITTFYLKDAQSLNFALPVEWIGEVAGEKVQQPQPENSQWEWEGPPVPIEPKARLALCHRWIQAGPSNHYAWWMLGTAYGELGRHREAIEAYREALRLKPDHAFTWFDLGVAYGKLDRYREAIEAYQEALRLSKPNYADSWYASAWRNLGVAYAKTGNRSAALEAVKELRRYDPQGADELFTLIIKP